MAEYCFCAVGTNETPKIVKAKEFQKALVDDECVEVHLRNCVIEGDVDISKAGIPFDENEKYSINKAIICRNCTFKQKTDFTEAVFSQNVNFSRTTFSQLANFRNAKFSGEADFISTKSEWADFRNATFCGEVYFSAATFSEGVNFRAATFNDSTNFRAATFSQEANKSIGEANFTFATFSGKVDFISAKFCGDADFSDATFSQEANFSSAEFKTPASFYGVKYTRNTFFQYLLRRNPTQFYIEDKDISAISNPFFKRYVADQQYIRAFEQDHPILARSWQWSSDYGRSLGLWAFWSAVIIFFFTCAYAHQYYDWIFGTIGVVALVTGIRYICHNIIESLPKRVRNHIVSAIAGKKSRNSDEPELSGYELLSLIRGKGLRWLSLQCLRVWLRCFGTWLLVVLVLVNIYLIALSVQSLEFNIPQGEAPKIISHLYFSVVIFTTLGFSNVEPLRMAEYLWIITEVILGYIMLGGLISIFANKLARRS